MGATAFDFVMPKSSLKSLWRGCTTPAPHAGKPQKTPPEAHGIEKGAISLSAPYL
jgi:hypothetical protein